MVRVDHDVNRLFRAKRVDERASNAARVDDGYTGVKADDAQMRDPIESADDGGDTARREKKRVASSDNHLPDLRPLTDVIKSALERGGIQHRPFLADDLATEAKATIDRA